MSRWFRHYAGMMRDDKLVSVAIKSRQTIERVVWIWAAILESAAEIDDEGRYRLDAAEIAYFLRADEADILSVESALVGAGRVDAGRVVKWGNRQFRSDRSAERVAAHRERKRSVDHRSQGNSASRNGAVKTGALLFQVRGLMISADLLSGDISEPRCLCGTITLVPIAALAPFPCSAIISSQLQEAADIRCQI